MALFYILLDCVFSGRETYMFVSWPRRIGPQIALHYLFIKLGLDTTKPVFVFRVSDKARLKPVFSAPVTSLEKMKFR